MPTYFVYSRKSSEAEDRQILSIDSQISELKRHAARMIDLSTLTLAGAPIAIRPNGTSMFSFEDVNGDGLSDLIVQVNTQSLQLSPAATQVTLDGMTITGMAIKGIETVEIVPPEKSH